MNEDGSFLVSLTALGEIYTELDVYGEYPFDFEEVALNPEIEGEIVENIKESPFYSSLIRKAYAEEDAENVEIEIEILPASKKKNTNFKLTLL